MIVICTKCHAKFRMADERVGPRGAKVRCSKCETVFLVAPHSPHSPDARRPPPLPPPLPSAPARRAETKDARPPPAFPAAPLAAAHDPFASPAAAADPFRSGGFSPLPPADPFAGPDPFAPSGTADPFDVPGTPESSGAGPQGGEALRAATDLGDLLGPATPTSLPRPRGGSAPAFPAPSPLDPDLDGLALEERSTPAPAPVLFDGDGGGGGGGALDPFARPDPGGFDPAAFDFGASAGGELALAGEPERGPSPAPLPAEDRPREAAHDEELPDPWPRERRARKAAPGGSDGAAVAAATAAPADARRPGARGSRLRAAAVNAMALAALLLAALAMLAVWRADGPLDASALRPLSLVRALRTASAPGPFATQGIRSGLYEREKGPPFLFVRGDVVSRAPAPVAAVQVEVEVVREGKVIARGEAIAGAVPTPEELHRAPDAAALAAVARSAAARAPSEVRPGDVVPFLVAIGDHPTDLSGASLRIALAGAEAVVR